MIDLQTDKLLTIAQACRLLPKPPSPTTFWRWRTKGVNGVKLECVRVGKKWMTTAAAFEAFCRQQNEPQGSDDSERSEKTALELKRSGLLR